MKYVVKMSLALLTLALLTAVPTKAQQQEQQQGQQRKPPTGQTGQQPAQQPGAEPAKPAVNPEEEKAYEAFYKIPQTDPSKVVDGGEDFLKKFPESRYRESVYSRLTRAYQSTGKLDKMFEAGDKALELNPDDVDILALLGESIPRRINPNNAIDANQKLDKAEKYCKRAIELLATMTKPSHLTEEQFAKGKNESLAMARSGLGLVYFNRQRYSEAVGEFEQVTKLTAAPDGVDFYLLGAALQGAKRYDESITALSRCVELPGSMQEPCKALREQVKKQAALQPAPPKQ